MPTEIADSDGGSELNSPAKVDQLVRRYPPEAQQSSASNDLGVHFSDFLSQEQQIHEDGHLRSPTLPQTTNHTGPESRPIFAGIEEGLIQDEHAPQQTVITVQKGTVQPRQDATETTPITSRKRTHTPRDCGHHDAGESDQRPQKR